MQPWEKNNRNSIRREAIDALETVISRLNELDDDKSTSFWLDSLESISYLEIVKDNLMDDMED